MCSVERTMIARCTLNQETAMCMYRYMDTDGWINDVRTHGCVHLHAFKSCIHMNMRIMYAYLYASYMRNMRIRTCADLLHLVVNEPTGVCMCVRMCI